jgi:signal transduction histidine kinase
VLTPQPRPKELDRLVEPVQAAGPPVQVAVEGEARGLPPSVDGSAYPIVPEALTNVLKHAGPAHARVFLRYRTNDLELEIADDGPGTGDGSGPGYGLIGMRELVLTGTCWDGGAVKPLVDDCFRGLAVTG